MNIRELKWQNNIPLLFIFIFLRNQNEILLNKSYSTRTRCAEEKHPKGI